MSYTLGRTLDLVVVPTEVYLLRALVRVPLVAPKPLLAMMNLH